MKEDKKKDMHLDNTEDGIFEEAYFVMNKKGEEPTALPDMINEANRIIEEAKKEKMKESNGIDKLLRFIVLTAFVIAAVVSILMFLQAI